MVTLIGLLVGIDNYPVASELSSLRGCRNDIAHWKALLEEYYSGTAPPRLRVLTDEEATYGGVVTALTEAIALVQPGDQFCFVYCGHGSREPAAPAFADYFPEGLEETLVCYDSRLPGGLELADKELTYLLQDVADRGGEATVILDCCHAGSGTRKAAPPGIRVRRAPERRGERALETYLRGRIAADLRRQGSDYRLPHPPHVLLAACRRTEEARELPTRRGLLSSVAESVIRKAEGRLTYADLYRQITAAALGVTDAQHPVLETYGGRDAYAGLLGTVAEGGRVALPVTRHPDGRWSVPLGAVHGLAGETAGALHFQMLRDGQPIAVVRARSVGFDRTSLVPPAGDLAEGTYTALRQSPPRPPEFVYLSVDKSWETELTAAGASRPSSYFSLSTAATQAAYRVVDEREGLQFVRRIDGRGLYAASGPDRAAVVAAVLERVETVMRWEYLLRLGLGRAASTTPTPELVLETRTGSEWREASAEEEAVTVRLPVLGEHVSDLPFRVIVRNTDQRRTCYAALFFTTENYTFYFTGFNEPLGPGQSVVAWDTLADGSPARFASSGAPSSTHHLKLFVSGEAIDVTGLDRQGFLLGQHDQLAGPRVQRGVVPGIDGFAYRAPGDDWRGIVARVRVLEQQPVIGDRPVSLLEGQVRVRPRADKFSARLGLSALGGGARGLTGEDGLAALLAGSDVDVVKFASATRGAEQYAVLELTDLEHPEALVAAPLEIELRQALSPEQGLQALAYDGEHLLPVGEFGEAEADGRQLLRIHHLPPAAAGDRRSAIGAVKMIIYKYVARQPGYLLRWVDYSGAEPHRTATDLKSRVKEAKNILLLIHGIIGDTRGMASFSQELVARGDFDLVLTFDYENLVTRLEKTSTAFATALEEAGIREEQRLIILAHSMGGLVARHYIECQRGTKLVDGLLMAGTPNAGSEMARLAKYRDYAILLLGFAINNGWAMGAATILLGSLKVTRSVSRTLEQMLPDSPFLGELERAADPGIPYRVLAGNLEDYLDSHADARRLKDKLYRLGGRLFYRNLPNDVAVSIASITSVERDRTPVPQDRQIACHHLNYFTDRTSVAALEEFLTELR